MSVDTNTSIDASAAPVPSADGASAIKAPSSVGEYMAAGQQLDEPVTVTAGVEATPVVPDAPRSDVDRLEPEPVGPLKLECGIEIEIVPLKLRETMKLLKIVTRGAGGALEAMIGQLDMEDPAVFAQTLGALILLSIPEAEDEAVDFIQSMVLPANFANLEPQVQIEKLNELAQELLNPELDDVVTIVERIVRRESEDIRNLGKRITTAFQMSRRVGVLPANS